MAIEVQEEALKSVLEGLSKDRERYAQMTEQLGPRLCKEAQDRQLAVILGKELVLVTLFGYEVLTNP